MTEVRRGITIRIAGDERDFAEASRRTRGELDRLERRFAQFQRRQQAFQRATFQAQRQADRQQLQAQRQADRQQLESQRVAGRQQVEVQRQTGHQRLEAQRQAGRDRLAAERATARRELEIIRETGRQQRFEQQRADRQLAARRRRSGIFTFGSLVPFAGAFAVQQIGREVLRLSDQWTIANSRVRLYTDTVAEARATQQALFDLSQETRSELGATVLVYQRISQAGETLGVSQERLLRFVETLNKALLISGVTAAEARATIIQLGQGLASDELRGQELRSVFEQGPRIAQALAESLNVSLGQLRELAFSGGLTARTVFEGIESQAQVIEAEFERINVTADQAFTVLGNALARAIGKFNEATGAIDGFNRRLLNTAEIIEGFDFSSLTLAERIIGTSDTGRFIEQLRQINDEEERRLFLQRELGVAPPPQLTIPEEIVQDAIRKSDQLLSTLQRARQRQLDQLNQEVDQFTNQFIEDLTREVERDLAELSQTPPPTPLDRNLQPIDRLPEDQVRARIAAEQDLQRRIEETRLQQQREFDRQRNEAQRQLDQQRIEEIRQRLRSIEGIEINIDLRGLSSAEIEQVHNQLRQLADEDIQRLQAQYAQAEQAAQRWAEINARALSTVRQELFNLISGLSTFEQFFKNLLLRLGEIAFNEAFNSLTADLQGTLQQGLQQSQRAAGGSGLLNSLLSGGGLSIPTGNRAGAPKPTVAIYMNVDARGAQDPQAVGQAAVNGGAAVLDYLGEPQGRDLVRSLVEPE